jgi:hypothetical protein
MVDNDGKVTGVGDNPKETLQQLVDQYVELSGQIVKNALGSIFAKYPSLNLPNEVGFGQLRLTGRGLAYHAKIFLIRISCHMRHRPLRLFFC